MKHVIRRLLILSVVLTMCVAVCLSSGVVASGTKADAYMTDILTLKHTLRFTEDGKFKIVIFSDIQDSYPMQSDTLVYMNKILDQEKPDLVLLGGDNHSGTISSESVFRQYLNDMSEPMESRKIPWAQVYGNHVTGGYGFTMSGPDKSRQQQIYEGMPYNVSKAGTVFGVGNYVLPVLRSDSEKVAFNVFMMDSHTYLIDWRSDAEEKAILPKMTFQGGEYNPIHFDQIKWYWDTSVAMEMYNGEKIPAMMLFHIPLQEYCYITNNPNQTSKTGTNEDGPGASSVNSGLFHACFERGDVKALFSGHQHRNTITGQYMGITLGYTPTIGSCAYYSEGTRGARVVEINQNDAFNFTTRIVYCKDLK
ncbi:MAG: metallophosphoesterase family protein [Clostridia bacterium]|nr:metallophosphoesterase family protein [Clostridia bacterium]